MSNENVKMFLPNACLFDRTSLVLTFWNNFEVELDKADLPAETKFAYLKELVEPSVRKGIDGRVC